MRQIQSPQPVRAPLLISSVLILLSLAVFLPALGHDFINLDDSDYISANPTVRRGLTWHGVSWAFTAYHAANWHPLTWLSHMVDVSLFGLAPWGHHLTNILVHAVNALALFLVLRSLTDRQKVSCGTTC